jgi:hypothetical protein
MLTSVSFSKYLGRLPAQSLVAEMSDKSHSIAT